MKKIINSRIFKIIRMIIVLTSMYFVPGLIKILLSNFLTNEKISSILSLLIYSLLLFCIFYKSLIEEFIIFKKNFKKSLDSGFKWWIIGLIIMLISNIIINVLIFKGGISTNEELNREALLGNPIYTMISSVLLAPFLEEIIFRKNLSDIFKSKYAFAIVSGLIFGLGHVISDLSNPLNLLYVIPYGSLGYAFCIMDRETKTTFTSVFIHMIHNFIASILIIVVVG